MRKVLLCCRKVFLVFVFFFMMWRKFVGLRLRLLKVVILCVGVVMYLEMLFFGSLLVVRVVFVMIMIILCCILRWFSFFFVFFCWYLWFWFLGWFWIRMNCIFVYKLYCSFGFFWLWMLGCIVVVVYSCSVIWKILRFVFLL